MVPSIGRLSSVGLVKKAWWSKVRPAMPICCTVVSTPRSVCWPRPDKTATPWAGRRRRRYSLSLTTLRAPVSRMNLNGPCPFNVSITQMCAWQGSNGTVTAGRWAEKPCMTAGCGKEKSICAAGRLSTMVDTRSVSSSALSFASRTLSSKGRVTAPTRRKSR